MTLIGGTKPFGAGEGIAPDRSETGSRTHQNCKSPDDCKDTDSGSGRQ